MDNKLSSLAKSTVSEGEDEEEIIGTQITLFLISNNPFL
jgi:hypothetical protein